MNKNVKCLILLIISLFLFSCSKSIEKDPSFSLPVYNDPIEKDRPYTFLLDQDSSYITVNALLLDSMVITPYSNDSLLIAKYSYGRVVKNRYSNIDDELWERRIKRDNSGNISDIDLILTFSKKDTSFIYHSERSKNIFMPLDYSYADCRYSFKNHGDEFTTIKESLLDTTYKEIFFYDKDYNINKYINTWIDNKYVYNK